MGKRPRSIPNSGDMEIQALKSDMSLLTKRVEELMMMISGNKIYGFTGIKEDITSLKLDMQKVKDEMAEIKKDNAERDKFKGLFVFNPKTFLQKVITIVTILLGLSSIIRNVLDVFMK